MIRDTDGNPISSYIGEIGPSAFVTPTIAIDCEENTKLSAETTGDFLIQARKVGDASWVDIESTPIDLTPYAPALTEFEIKITADAAIEGRNRFRLRVGA